MASWTMRHSSCRTSLAFSSTSSSNSCIYGGRAEVILDVALEGVTLFNESTMRETTTMITKVTSTTRTSTPPPPRRTPSPLLRARATPRVQREGSRCLPQSGKVAAIEDGDFTTLLLWLFWLPSLSSLRRTTADTGLWWWTLASS